MKIQGENAAKSGKPKSNFQIRQSRASLRASVETLHGGPKSKDMAKRKSSPERKLRVAVTGLLEVRILPSEFVGVMILP